MARGERNKHWLERLSLEQRFPNDGSRETKMSRARSKILIHSQNVLLLFFCSFKISAMEFKISFFGLLFSIKIIKICSIFDMVLDFKMLLLFKGSLFLHIKSKRTRNNVSKPNLYRRIHIKK